MTVYNASLAFTSLGVDVDQSTLQGTGSSSFCIHGSLHHLLGTLEPPENHAESVYAQLYIFDTQKASDIHHQCNPNLDLFTLQELHDILFNHHLLQFSSFLMSSFLSP